MPWALLRGLRIPWQGLATQGRLGLAGSSTSSMDRTAGLSLSCGWGTLPCIVAPYYNDWKSDSLSSPVPVPSSVESPFLGNMWWHQIFTYPSCLRSGTRLPSQIRKSRQIDALSSHTKGGCGGMLLKSFPIGFLESRKNHSLLLGPPRETSAVLLTLLYM